MATKKPSRPTRPTPTPPARAAAPVAAPKAKPTPPGVSANVLLVGDKKMSDVLASQTKVMDRRAERAGAPAGTRIKVVAKMTCYTKDNQRKREGDVFVINAEEFSAKSMRRVDAKTPNKVTGPNANLARQHDAILGGKQLERAEDVNEETGDVETGDSDEDGPDGPADE